MLFILYMSLCMTDIDECQNSPCIHGNCVNGINQYTCECLTLYIGANCTTGLYFTGLTILRCSCYLF